MAQVYTAYTKSIGDTTYFFVKSFQSFPDLKDVPSVLENFGMHTNFDKACSIAAIHDAKTKAQIFNDLNSHVPMAKVIELGAVNYTEKKAAR